VYVPDILVSIGDAVVSVTVAPGKSARFVTLSVKSITPPYGTVSIS